jgi:putative flippase GtrA
MTRQFLLFVAVGLLQYGVDALVFAALFFLGVPVAGGNLLARASGAVVGFQVNGMLTFRSQRGDQGWGLTHGIRFGLLWLAMTAVSTSLMLVCDHLIESGGLARAWIIGAKLLIEAVLALISFALSKWWVYTS